MFHPFDVEQFLSELEHGVKYNYSESGVHPMTLRELVDLVGLEPDVLWNTMLDYPQVNGSTFLREKISAMYPGTNADNVLVTVGATEANTLIANTLLQPGDSMVAFRPIYEQLTGDARNRGVDVRYVDMEADNGWAIDPEAVMAAVGPTTKLIHVINPNNPTGRVLSNREREGIIAAAASVGAWIVADEVYIGTERDTDEATPSFWGAYDKVMVLNSTSKAYGLPGLRLGWLVGPADAITACWRRHEYASVATSTVSMKLAEAALAEPARTALVERARRLIRTGFETLTEALAVHHNIFTVAPPHASAMSFVRFNLPIDSETLAMRLVREQDVLVIPGSRFHVENHFRFSSALPEAHLKEGLRRLNLVVEDVLKSA
ncbi:aminotransferase class I/II-fold pyridoxal phosphate-dependent enzyme [Roseibium album]|uniref:Aminotransferase n=1 Tax=Roseibium album TaxID=311410 RepID=A0A0M6ZF91_9HYPH|nr:aminotransferase class I/II-fold pyridoxal phosphate-dependent enzyme [Roseibium album]MBG6145217.1 aspartate/methionine/tyrosine aminotransferase [Labrenzia sp. EL_142]CTQ60802.1 Arginine--pyruvate transaminase AruH [Roseibium album]CTQ64969.1 Arginine--pyruvate transaminase AruH [Roseibium album]CTQ73100.1 Arginine--pyruvate transaminase AruH [Roseibium album]